jgi:hypothetical protein
MNIEHDENEKEDVCTYCGYIMDCCRCDDDEVNPGDTDWD